MFGGYSFGSKSYGTRLKNIPVVVVVITVVGKGAHYLLTKTKRVAHLTTKRIQRIMLK